MPEHIETTRFLVSKRQLEQYRFESSAPTKLAGGDILASIEKLAFTANNITYAVMGERLSYWDFFPAKEGWGSIPAWGFASVIASRHEGISEGERLYGYFPVSSHTVLTPGKLSERGFKDASAHRQQLAGVYNRYERVSAHHREGLEALLRPLFLTAFLIDAFLANNVLFGAETILLSSASSKTAIATAYMLNKRLGKAYRLVGLTSPANETFVKGLSCYDQVMRYETLKDLPGADAVYLDFSGNAPLRRELHQHFRMRHSALIGAAHWEQLAATRDLPGATPTTFFAPSEAKRRVDSWGADVFQQRVSDAWQDFLNRAEGWFTLSKSVGRAGVGAVYLDTLAGRVKPDTGHIVSLRSDTRP